MSSVSYRGFQFPVQPRRGEDGIRELQVGELALWADRRGRWSGTRGPAGITPEYRALLEGRAEVSDYLRGLERRRAQNELVSSLRGRRAWLTVLFVRLGLGSLLVPHTV